MLGQKSNSSNFDKEINYKQIMLIFVFPNLSLYWIQYINSYLTPWQSFSYGLDISHLDGSPILNLSSILEAIMLNFGKDIAPSSSNSVWISLQMLRTVGVRHFQKAPRSELQRLSKHSRRKQLWRAYHVRKCEMWIQIWKLGNHIQLVWYSVSSFKFNMLWKTLVPFPQDP